MGKSSTQLKLASMTGFARSQGEVLGETGAIAWIWELRSVNGRGLDLKLRPAVRAGCPGGRLAGCYDQIAEARQCVRHAEPEARDGERAGGGHGGTGAGQGTWRSIWRIISPAPCRRGQSCCWRLPGVMRNVSAQDDSEALQAALQGAVRAGYAEALDGLVAARAGEGARLAEIVSAAAGRDFAPAWRRRRWRRRPKAGFAQSPADGTVERDFRRATPGLPEDRIAQEVALLATKSDVREELDRLGAHIGAARALLAEAAGIGRKFDFLVQEFNREANTLCSKVGIAAR